jgi:hypothetical protein
MPSRGPGPHHWGFVVDGTEPDHESRRQTAKSDIMTDLGVRPWRNLLENRYKFWRCQVKNL